MILLNPKKHRRPYPDERSREIMTKTIAFLENKGLKKIKKDYHEKAWNYDFVEFLRKDFCNPDDPQRVWCRGLALGYLSQLRVCRNYFFLRADLLVHLSGEHAGFGPHLLRRK